MPTSPCSCALRAARRFRSALPGPSARSGATGSSCACRCRTAASVTACGRSKCFVPAAAVRYFVNVIPFGGPRLVREPEPTYVYTGDTISPLLRIRQADGSWPDHVHMNLTVKRPSAGLGNLLSDANLGAAVVIDGDE